MKRNKCNNFGYSLVEVLFAALIISTGALVVFNLTRASIVLDQKTIDTFRVVNRLENASRLYYLGIGRDNEFNLTTTAADDINSILSPVDFPFDLTITNQNFFIHKLVPSRRATSSDVSLRNTPEYVRVNPYEITPAGIVGGTAPTADQTVISRQGHRITLTLSDDSGTLNNEISRSVDVFLEKTSY